MCGFPADALNGNIEKLRKKYGVTVSKVGKDSGERFVYFMGPTLGEMARGAERSTPGQDAPAIPDDEIDRLLRHGSGYHGNKLRIAVLYAGDSTPADRAEYLKRTAGAAGSSLTAPTAISSTAPRGL